MMVADGQDVAGPPAGADMILLRSPASVREARDQAARLKTAGWLKPGASDPILLGVPRSAPGDQAVAIRAMQEEGANAIALCPWVPGDSDALAPSFSAASFPRRP